MENKANTTPSNSPISEQPKVAPAASFTNTQTMSPTVIKPADDNRSAATPSATAGKPVGEPATIGSSINR
jgi:hypothetical protein